MSSSYAMGHGAGTYHTVVNLPPGTIRYRLRQRVFDVVRIFVKYENGCQCFYAKHVSDGVCEPGPRYASNMGFDVKTRPADLPVA